MPELTWGLDVSTRKAKTVAVALGWSTPGEASVVDVRRPLRAVDRAPLISEHRESRWAVDVPFGWPDQFVPLCPAVTTDRCRPKRCRRQPIRRNGGLGGLHNGSPTGS
jgi:hypothetical protein